MPLLLPSIQQEQRCGIVHIKYRCVLEESNGEGHGSIISEAVERQIQLLESFLSTKGKVKFQARIVTRAISGV